MTTLKAEKRDPQVKAKKLRREGFVTGVLYGKEMKENVALKFEEKEAFVQLDLQYGAVPYYFFVNEEFLRTSAFRVGVNCRFRVSNNFFIQPIFMFELEEYIPKEFRNRYNTQLILSKRF